MKRQAQANADMKPLANVRQYVFQHDKEWSAAGFYCVVTKRGVILTRRPEDYGWTPQE